MKKNLLTEKEISPWVHRAHHVSSGWRKVWTESNAGNSSHFSLSPQSQKDVSLASFRLLKLFFMERWEVNKNATNTFGRHKNKADDYHELTILDRLPIDIFAKRNFITNRWWYASFDQGKYFDAGVQLADLRTFGVHLKFHIYFCKYWKIHRRNSIIFKNAKKWWNLARSKILILILERTWFSE